MGHSSAPDFGVRQKFTFARNSVYVLEFKPRHLIGLVALFAWLALALPIAVWGWTSINPAAAWLIMPTTPFLISLFCPRLMLVPWTLLLFSAPSYLADTSASSMDGGAFFNVLILTLNLPILFVRGCLLLSRASEDRNGYLS